MLFVFAVALICASSALAFSPSLSSKRWVSRSLKMSSMYAPVLQDEITDTIFFDIEADNQSLGRISMGLYGSVVPKTVLNFKELCKGCDSVVSDKQIGFKGSAFHRVIPQFMLQVRTKRSLCSFASLHSFLLFYILFIPQFMPRC
jgi:hypothetical protein